MPLSSSVRRAGANAFPFTIETVGGAVLGAASDAGVALAMYHAARQSYFQNEVVLKRDHEVLPVS